MGFLSRLISKSKVVRASKSESDSLAAGWESLKTYRGAPSASIVTVSPASACARMAANWRWKLRRVVLMSDSNVSDTGPIRKREIDR